MLRTYFVVKELGKDSYSEFSKKTNKIEAIHNCINQEVFINVIILDICQSTSQLEILVYTTHQLKSNLLPKVKKLLRLVNEIFILTSGNINM